MGLLAKQSKEQIKSTAISQQSSEIARSEWLLKRLGKTLQSYPMANLDKSGMDHFTEEWSLILTEVGEGRFDEALGEHIRESKFFPTIAELRERCGMKKADKDSVEAMDHWIRLKKFVKANYYEDLGGLHGQEKIPQRVSYAMTSVGGARAIYLMDLDSEPFKRKDFVEAYRLAPLHEQMQQAQLESVLPKFLDSGEDESPRSAGQ